SYYWAIEDKIPSAKAFNDRFRKMYGGQVPTDYGALGYAGVKAVLTGIKKANSTDTEKVVEALEGLTYDFYKGPEYYRKCDHQAVQSVFIIESKSNGQRSAADVFNILETDEPNEAK